MKKKPSEPTYQVMVVVIVILVLIVCYLIIFGFSDCSHGYNQTCSPDAFRGMRGMGKGMGKIIECLVGIAMGGAGIGVASQSKRRKREKSSSEENN